MKDINDIILTIQEHFFDGISKIKIFNDERELVILKEESSICGLNFSYKIVCDVDGILITNDIEDVVNRLSDVIKFGKIKMKI